MIQIFWTVQPTHVRLFELYLAWLLAGTMFRAMRIGRQLYGISAARAAAPDIAGGRAEPDLLATSAIAGKVPRETAALQLQRLNYAEREAALNMMERADIKFRYLSDSISNRFAWMRRTVMLTLFLLSLVLAYGGLTTYGDICNNSKLTGSECFLATIGQLLVRLIMGLSVCAIVYAIRSGLEDVLQDRKTKWEYVSDNLKDLVAKNSAENGGSPI